MDTRHSSAFPLWAFTTHVYKGGGERVGGQGQASRRAARGNARTILPSNALGRRTHSILKHSYQSSTFTGERYLQGGVVERRVRGCEKGHS